MVWMEHYGLFVVAASNCFEGSFNAKHITDKRTDLLDSAEIPQS